ncbi:MAG: hypothetical protein KDA90_01805 [Planctomycetaceae bacterium]|nr:hypothetical protein [Planctomycetaceae bacterium]
MHCRLQLLVVSMTAMLGNTAFAQGYYAPPQAYSNAPQVQAVGHQQVYQQPYVAPSYGAYPQLSAPLYPAPVQNTPAYAGRTLITNQAFAPHEMLYPHDYHAMYGPFYYKVHGGWIWTPLGMRQHENWKLQGTEVKVKYRSQIPLLTGYH